MINQLAKLAAILGFTFAFCFSCARSSAIQDDAQSICKLLDEQRSSSELIESRCDVTQTMFRGSLSDTLDNGEEVLWPTEDIELQLWFEWVISPRIGNVSEFSSIQTSGKNEGVETSVFGFRGTFASGTLFWPYLQQKSQTRTLQSKDAPVYGIEHRNFELDFHSRPLLLSSGWLPNERQNLVSKSWTQLLESNELTIEIDANGQKCIKLPQGTEERCFQVYLNDKGRVVREIYISNGFPLWDTVLTYDGEKLSRASQSVSVRSRRISVSNSTFVPLISRDSSPFHYEIPTGTLVRHMPSGQEYHLGGDPKANQEYSIGFVLGIVICLVIVLTIGWRVISRRRAIK